MSDSKKIKIAVIGASGYTGSDLIRLALCHPNIEIEALIAHSHAGNPVGDVFPHLAHFGLPDMVDISKVDWAGIDAAFCGLPHGTAQDIIAALPDHVKVIDMSADFRLRDADTYEEWYGRSHDNKDLLKTAVYGLSEHYRDEIAKADLVACPGCYPTATLLALIPLLKSSVIKAEDIIIDAKSGVSGAGRSLKQNTLFTEAGEGLSPYSVGKHRHAPEIDQELSVAAGSDVIVNFTPHLIPMSRGELVTCYVKMADGKTVEDLRKILDYSYAQTEFVRVLDDGVIPATQQVRGSNYCNIAVMADRIPGRAIVISTLDNLVKGSAGQALQNFNLMFGLEEKLGLEQKPLFP
ncbi:MAG: N-acetyl-gamma-glutamyl-phosphate reductase [Methyloligellaceae bacterium]